MKFFVTSLDCLNQFALDVDVLQNFNSFLHRAAELLGYDFAALAIVIPHPAERDQRIDDLLLLLSG
jgi:hypothetical protein